MRAQLLLILSIPVWLGACSAKQESVVKEEPKPSLVLPPPPPPPDGIWDRVDSVASREDGLIYSGFQLLRAADFSNQKLPCCLRFQSFFIDISTIGIQQRQNNLVFHFSRFNDPRHFDEKKRKMVDIAIDDESQDVLFFEVPMGKSHFRYTDKQLLAAKLTYGISCNCAHVNMVEAGIQAGVLEGWQLNDTTWQVKLHTSYIQSDDDSSWAVRVNLDQRFYLAKPDTSIWHYRCRDEQ